MIPDDAQIGRRVKEAAEIAGARKGTDLFRQLCRVTGLQRVTVHRIIKGETTANVNHLRKIARWAGLPLAWFFEDGNEG